MTIHWTANRRRRTARYVYTRKKRDGACECANVVNISVF